MSRFCLAAPLPFNMGEPIWTRFCMHELTTWPVRPFFPAMRRVCWGLEANDGDTGSAAAFYECEWTDIRQRRGATGFGSASIGLLEQNWWLHGKATGAGDRGNAPSAIRDCLFQWNRGRPSLYQCAPSG